MEQTYNGMTDCAQCFNTKKGRFDISLAILEKIEEYNTLSIGETDVIDDD